MNFIDEIKAYVPFNETQKEIKEKALKLIAENENILTRDCLDQHISSSGFIMDETLENCLMVYHNIYKSFGWTGGHNDGNEDMLRVALKEAKEETGITSVLKASGLIRLDILPVCAHIKNGKPVKEHVHINGTYILIADKNQPIRIKPDENSAVAWISVSDLDDRVEEKALLVIYKELVEQAKQLRKEGKI